MSWIVTKHNISGSHSAIPNLPNTTVASRILKKIRNDGAPVINPSGLSESTNDAEFETALRMARANAISPRPCVEREVWLDIMRSYKIL